MKGLVPEADMQRVRDRNRIVWGAVVGLVVLLFSHKHSAGVRAVLCLAAIVLGGFLGGWVYAWTWRLRLRAWEEEALAPGAGIEIYTGFLHDDRNWGPLWRKITRSR